MARLIDADALGRDAFHVMCEGEYGEPCERCVVDWDDIETAPTIDAVEVVRCKDCEHSDYSKCDIDGVLYCAKHSRFMVDDDFCSYGKRRQSDG